jgi:hypothetical protein
MLLITCNQVIRTRGIGAFDKHIVITTWVKHLTERPFATLGNSLF